MIIAVNTSFTAVGPTGTNDLLLEYFSYLALQQPQHQFIYIVDKDFNEKYITAANSFAVVAGSAPTNPLLLQYRLNYTIPAILRKHKATVFISVGCCSLRTAIPQCIIINGLSFLKHPELYAGNWLRFYKKNTPKCLAAATSIATATPFLKEQLVAVYKIDAGKIDIVHCGASDAYQPATWQEKDAVKERYTEGLEYFLYSGPIEPRQNLVNLLKAFSFFKKRQKSNMQLVIASTTAASDNVLIKSLATFKFRNEVKLLEKLPTATLAKITGSAYALVYPSHYENFAGAIPAAMQAAVPVIAGNMEAMRDLCADAVLYSNTNDFNDIAEKMMLLFKDESRRNGLIEKGKQQAALYGGANTTQSLWKAIVKSAGTSF